MKKILKIVSLVLLFVAMAGGIVYFYLKNENQIKMNAELAAQNAQVQSQIQQIGQLATVYQVAAPKESGGEVKIDELITVSVPVSSLSDNAVTDVSMLKGKFYKININPGTTLTTDLLMDDSTEVMRYTRDINLNYLPIGTKVNDYIDIRVLFPTGEEFMVIPHKKINRIVQKTISVHMSEEELHVWNAAMLDYATAQRNGMVLYVTKYLEPGKDTDSLPFYPVQHEAENLVMYNSNIKDYTRVINSNLRDHIDHLIGTLKLTGNQEISSDTASFFNTEASTIASAYDTIITNEKKEKEDAEMTIPLEGGSVDEGNMGDSAINAAGDALDSIKNSTDALTNTGNKEEEGIE